MLSAQPGTTEQTVKALSKCDVAVERAACAMLLGQPGEALALLGLAPSISNSGQCYAADPDILAFVQVRLQPCNAAPAAIGLGPVCYNRQLGSVLCVTPTHLLVLTLLTAATSSPPRP